MVLLPPHGQYFLGPPNPMAPAPMYKAGGGGGGVVDGSMSISGIKSWLRQAMYVPERSAAALSISVPAAPPSEAPLPPAAGSPSRASTAGCAATPTLHWILRNGYVLNLRD